MNFNIDLYMITIRLMEDICHRVYVDAPADMEDELLNSAYEQYNHVQENKTHYKIVNMSKYNLSISSESNLPQVTLAVEAMEYAENYN